MTLKKASSISRKLSKPKDLPKTEQTYRGSNPNDRFGTSNLTGYRFNGVGLPGTVDQRTVLGNTLNAQSTATGYNPAPGAWQATPTALGAPGDVPDTLSGDLTGNAGGMPNGYSPAGYGAAFYQNPDALAADVLAGMGITNPEMVDLFTDLAGVGTALDLIMNMGQGGGVQTVDQTANFIDAMMQGQLTPGGTAIDPNTLIAAIMNADPDSPLGRYMATEGPNGVNALIQASLVAGGGNPYAQRGVMNMMQTQAQDYNRALARIDPTTADPYYQGLRNGPLGRYLG